MSGTKEQIMDAAERLFAQHGVAGTSLRGIMSEAGQNPAAVHYHFGGKDALVEAVLARRIEPVNEDRNTRFDELERRAGSEPVPPRALIEAYVGPSLRLQGAEDFDGAGFLRFLGRFYAESGDTATRLLESHFRPVVERFAALLRPSLPDLDPQRFAWRVHFLVGAMAHTLSCRAPLSWLEPEAESTSVDDVVEQLVDFATAAMFQGAPTPAGPPTSAGREAK